MIMQEQELEDMDELDCGACNCKNTAAYVKECLGVNIDEVIKEDDDV